ncbi:PAS domain S-box protein [Marivirga sp. S37H4]|uniref:PAS domain S-box protein n=1 Tax=Marivirga aurantiaca TaxID=2802615 RepID=A0A934WVP0_9BACT|nr:CheR family methyltransferase [Marivirga aurantiaca]MBK6263913.1 PAS domain S-box protein [Marivirga aurantiaca]
MTEKENKDSYVVGVGLNGGGLDALAKFLNSFYGAEADFCLVVVMQFHSDNKNKLINVIKKYSSWPIVTSENNSSLQARHIYLAPQNHNISFKNGFLKTEAGAQNFPIDTFFSSLAKERKGKAIGVILSGTGSDGSEGIKAIREANGYTMAQMPDTAECKGMPSSAIQSNHIDIVLPAEQMFQEIVHYVNNHQLITESKLPKKGIDAIFELLEKRSGTDFSQYKPTTILRRVNYRMNKLQLSSLADYYAMIEKNPKELDILFETVLIGVTEFFRDKNAYDSLSANFQKLIKSKKPEDPIRIWCVGCATGEEPYSIAILLHEILGADISKYDLQIFASDIDERVLNFARKGIYQKVSVENIPPKLLAKYFDKKTNTHYEVKKTIKKDILFSRHDITSDPPFVKLDAIICRNLLIYFNNNLQKQTFQIFHFALRNNGLLFLGKSESVSVAAELFAKADEHKIYRKADASLDYRLKFSQFKNKNELVQSDVRKHEIRNMSVVDIAKETLYYKYGHPFVIINEQAEIKEVNGSLRLYLEISQGTMNANLTKMVNTELVTSIKILLAQVRKTNVPHTSQVIKFTLYEMDHYVKLKIMPLIYSVNDSRYYLVIFEKIQPGENFVSLQKEMHSSDITGFRIQELEDELSSLREHLQLFTEELESTNEELQITNEELQSTNEELKSANEELETSNEELQSANEELNMSNRDLNLSNEALKEKEAELKKAKNISEKNEIIYRTLSENIPNGSIGILNDQMKIEYLAGTGIKEFTKNSDELSGKAFLDLIKLSETEREKLTTILPKTLKGKTGNAEFYYEDNYYDLHTVPIKLPSDSKNKVLFLIQNITQAKKDHLKVMMAIEVAELVIYEYNYNTAAFLPNTALLKLFEFDESDLFNTAAFLSKYHPEDLSLRNRKNEEALKTGVLSYEARLLLKSGIRWIRVFGRILFDENKKPELEVATILDITKDKQLLEQIRESEERFRHIADSAPVKIWMSDVNKNATYFNKKWLDFVGQSLENAIGKDRLENVHPDDKKECEAIYNTSFDKKESFSMEYRLKRHDGEYRWILDHGLPVIDSLGNFEGFIGSCIDITAQKEFTVELEKKVEERTCELQRSNEELINLNISLEEYAHVASHDLQEPLRKITTFGSILKNRMDDPAAISKYIDKINSSAARMGHLIKDILDYSKISESSLDKSEVDLNVILEGIEIDLELEIKEKNAKIEFGDLGMVTANEVHITQLFSNLIKNAIKYNVNEPKITISAKDMQGAQLPAHLPAESNRKYKQIKMSDNGIGIAEEHYLMIFQPFKRLHSKSEYSGTGIGLAICRRIVEIHEGFIEVESKEGEGSTFVIYLPLNKT